MDKHLSGSGAAQNAVPTPPTELNWSLGCSAMGPLLPGGWKQHKQKPHIVRGSTFILNFFFYTLLETIFKGLVWSSSLLESNKSSENRIAIMFYGVSCFRKPFLRGKKSIAYSFRGRHAYSRYHTISIVYGDRFSFDWHLMWQSTSVSPPLQNWESTCKTNNKNLCLLIIPIQFTV